VLTERWRRLQTARAKRIASWIHNSQYTNRWFVEELFGIRDMKRAFCKGILSAAAVAGCVGAQVYAQVYPVTAYAGGTSYRELCSFTLPFPPYKCRLTDRGWYQDANGLHIIDVGHEKERGGIFHRALDVECGSESFTVPLEPVPRKAEQEGASTNEVVLAVVMESGHPEAAAALLAVMDGSASLYVSNGGGIIGAGQYPAPNAAARKLVAKAAEFRSACTLTHEFPFPEKGHTRIYIITLNGVLTSDAKEDELEAGRHRMSPLFRAARELSGQMRLAEEKMKKAGGAADGSQPIRSETNSTSSAAGSRR